MRSTSIHTKKNHQFDYFIVIDGTTTTYSAASDDKYVKLMIFWFQSSDFTLSSWPILQLIVSIIIHLKWKKNIALLFSQQLWGFLLHNFVHAMKEQLWLWWQHTCCGMQKKQQVSVSPQIITDNTDRVPVNMPECASN